MTVVAGLLLLPLLGVEIFTVLSVRRMLPVHIAVGLWLLPLVVIKMGSTGYRMAMYYLRDHDYFAAGPPAWVPRILAPFVVLSTIALFVSGTVLWAMGPAGRDPWLRVHQVAFVFWAGSTGLHVLIHLRRTVNDGLTEISPWGSGPSIRRRLVAGAAVVGLVGGVVGATMGPAWPVGVAGDENRPADAGQPQSP
jgi:multisubunit Na+/H+ antiporter MnhB subunit